ncbi:hypothetical protein GXW82_29795 [Streptacidiphilus sp. 4-A2]|nr:hypothetical protein [Streptacidiphilus sp. 4-A2]
MDRGMHLGEGWVGRLSDALASCRVFVPLYSPRYFRSEPCGQEWRGFASRQGALLAARRGPPDRHRSGVVGAGAQGEPARGRQRTPVQPQRFRHGLPQRGNAGAEQTGLLPRVLRARGAPAGPAHRPGRRNGGHRTGHHRGLPDPAQRLHRPAPLAPAADIRARLRHPAAAGRARAADLRGQRAGLAALLA